MRRWIIPIVVLAAIEGEAFAQSSGNAGFYGDAAEAFQRAETMPDGPDRQAAWRRAAELYEEALRRNPAADLAPEAAMLGAHAYKQLGEFDPAIALFELFILEYGSEARLARLEKGVPFLGRAPDPRRYAESVRFLGVAYEELVMARMLLFDYSRAAALYDQMAASTRLAADTRADAKRNAAILHTAIDQANPAPALATDLDILPAPTP